MRSFYTTPVRDTVTIEPTSKGTLHQQTQCPVCLLQPWLPLEGGAPFLPVKYKLASGHRIVFERGSLYSACPTLCCRGELAESSSPEALINDAATRMFWRNVKARTTGQAVSLAQATLELPGNKAGRSRSKPSCCYLPCWTLGWLPLHRLG